MTEQQDELRTIKRWVSAETLISIVVMLLGLAVTWGSLSTRIERLQKDVQELQSRDITPGAREQAAALRQADSAMQQQIIDLRSEMRLQRAEILEALTRLEAKLETHDSK